MVTRRLTVMLALAVALILMAAPLHAQQPPIPAPPQSDPFFGVVQAIHNPDRAVGLGVRWERLVVWWSNFQPNGPDEWKSDGWFSRNLIVDQRNRGIEPVGVVLHTPGWAAEYSHYPTTSPPANLDLPFDHPDNHWGQFLTRLAREYAGTVDAWILWNEPDIYRESFANWAGTVEEFARMQAVGYQAIKAGNPNATVLLTGTTYWWDIEEERQLYLDRLLAALAQQPGAQENGFFFDAVSVHQYSASLNSFTVPVLYRRVMATYGLNKPIWINESNAVPHDDPIAVLHRGGLRATMDEQASYVIQSVALARAAGVARYAIYKLVDEQPENDQFYGLVRNDGSIRPAYVAYQVAVRELSNVRDARYFWGNSAFPLSEDEKTALLASTGYAPQFVWPHALNGVRMARGNDRVTVLWNASGAPLPIVVPSSVASARVVNKYGVVQSISRAGDGAFHLTLAGATQNTDVRDERLALTGGDPVILIESGAATHRDPLPRVENKCWNVPGALAPTNPTPSEAWVAPTGYSVSGPWLSFMRANGDVDYVGYPRSPVMLDPTNPKQCIQVFQRLVLEWHPDNPPEYQIQRRLLVQELMGPEPAPPAPPTPNSADSWYFPKGPTGMGHAVSNLAPDGSRIGFKAYFDRVGREDALGYPMEPPTRRTGEDGVERWTQRFQAGILEFHPEFDIEGDKPGTALPWRTWTVQLRLLGDEYVAARGLPVIVGDAAQHRFAPPEPPPPHGN